MCQPCKCGVLLCVVPGTGQKSLATSLGCLRGRKWQTAGAWGGRNQSRGVRDEHAWGSLAFLTSSPSQLSSKDQAPESSALQRVTALARTSSKCIGAGRSGQETASYVPHSSQQPSWDFVPSYGRPGRGDTSLPPSQPTQLAESPPSNLYEEDGAISPLLIPPCSSKLRGIGFIHQDLSTPVSLSHIEGFPWNNHLASSWQDSAVFI